MIILETPRLIIRNWEDRDRELLHVINSDDEVMRFFPFRRNRAESDALFELLQTMIAETGFGFTLSKKSKADNASALRGWRAPIWNHIFRTALSKLAGVSRRHSGAKAM